MGKKALLEQFEKTKTYDLCKSWQIDFDEKAEIYYSINPSYHSDVVALNAAWRMFQEQQAKVEELQKRVDFLEKHLKPCECGSKEICVDQEGYITKHCYRCGGSKTQKTIEQALKGGDQ